MEPGGIKRTDSRTQIGLAETGHELLRPVVVVDAVAEPDPFQVDGEGLEEVAVPVALVAGVDGFEHAADAQVVAPVLVEEDVAPLQGGFGKVIDKGFLTEAQVVETGHLVAEHLDVGKLLVSVLETVGHGGGQRTGSYEHGDKLFFHYDWFC